MKTFNYLFYTGLTIVILPVFLILIMIVMPLIILENKSEVEQPRMVIYDTVEVKKVVKIYDTVRPKKVRIIEQKVVEVKTEVDTLTTQ
jgi:hypothetical protein